MHGTHEVFCYLGAGMLAFILSGIFVKCMVYLCNRVDSQRQAVAAAGAAQTTTRGGGFREVVVQTSPSRVQVVVEETRVDYDSEKIKETKGSLSNCTICISEIEDGELCWELTACNHSFHADCIQKWLKKNQTCPLCRTIIVVHAF